MDRKNWSYSCTENLRNYTKTKSWEIISEIGKKLNKAGLIYLFYNLKINISGLDAIATYSFDNDAKNKFKTYITQEMLKKGFLASTNFYSCTEHNESHVEKYFFELDKIFKTLSKCSNEELNIDSLLESDTCHSGFKRLN